MKKECGKSVFWAVCLLTVLTAGLLLFGGCGGENERTAQPYESSATSHEEDGLFGSESATAPEGDSGEKDQSGDESSEEDDGPPVRIGCGQSQQLALSYAGLTADQVTKLWSTLQKYEGTIIHEVTFVYDGSLYTYRINASTGEDMGFTKEPVE